jgi:outer membrane protein OmpA-like peptidoglycan-associated protein
MRIPTIVPLSTLLSLLLIPAVADAQIGGLINRARRAATDELGRKIEQLVRDGVRCVVGDSECVEQARKRGRTPVMTDANGKILTDDDGVPITDPDQAMRKAGPAAKPGSGAWANYDFTPGDRVLFAEDFANDRVGDFPRRFELLGGNWEIVEWQGSRYLRATAGGTVVVSLPATLPERFTVEFPASVQHGNGYVRLTTGPVDDGKRDYAGSAPSLEFSEGGLRPIKEQGPTTLTTRKVRGEAVVNVRIMADGAYMKMYLDDQRVANAPNAVFPRTGKLFFTAGWATVDNPVLIGPMRIAAGGLDLYDALEKHGRVATQGIYFATDSAVLRPESTATLREIGEMLRTHPTLRLSIDGHTDSDGDDAHNLDLSARRAAAVKRHLVDVFGIDAGRLETTGLGESKPVADNSTPEGKQQNRRVELVKRGG